MMPQPCARVASRSPLRTDPEPAVARKPKNRALVTIPGCWQPDFVERLDRRFKIAHAVRDRIAAIESDIGGRDTLSYARRCLVRRLVWLEAVVETFEQRLAAGQTVDMGQYTQALNTLLGLLRSVGWERKPQNLRTLRDVMNSPSSPPRALQEPPP